MFNTFHRFIYKLQRSDDATKKRWITIFTAFVMFLVLIFWGVSLRTNLALNNYGSDDKESGFSQSWPVFKNGASVVGERFFDGGKNLVAAFNKLLFRSQEIFPQNLKFNNESAEPVSPKRLKQ